MINGLQKLEMSSDYYTEKLICTLEKYEDIKGA